MNIRSREQKEGNIKDVVWKTGRNSNTIVLKKSLSGRKMVDIGNERFEVVVKHVLGSGRNIELVCQDWK